VASNTLFIEEDDTFRSLIARAEAGEEIVITRRGKPVARLASLPAVSDADRNRALAALARISQHAKEMNAGPFDWEEWKTYRDEGRR
jgi:prevent-host-death family protein